MTDTEAITRFNEKMRQQASYVDFIEETAKENPVEGAYMLWTGLMRGDPVELRLGYGIGSAFIATLEHLERWGITLTTSQLGVLIERVAVPKDGLVEYGPTSR